jgi:hypothetical protein
MHVPSLKSAELVVTSSEAVDGTATATLTGTATDEVGGAPCSHLPARRRSVTVGPGAVVFSALNARPGTRP